MAPATKWGIVGAGKISHDFVSSFAALDIKEHVVVAVAARNSDSAEKFAVEHEIPKAFGSYEELMKDTEVAVVYIGCLIPNHFATAKLALSYGKHVLCEMSLCVNARETKELLDYAKKQGLFIMEAIWTRFLPSYRYVMEQVESNAIGDVKQVIVSFGAKFYEWERFQKKETGGGTLLEISVFAIQLVTNIWKGETPIKVVGAGHFTENCIDLSSTSVLIYENGRTATILVDSSLQLPNEAIVVGTKGTLKLNADFWCSESVETPTGVKDFKIPRVNKKFKYGGTAVGMSFQAAEVRKCITSGLTESPSMSHQEALLIAEIKDEMRRQVGVEYAQDLHTTK